MKRMIFATVAAMAAVAIMVPTVASAVVTGHSFGATGTRFQNGLFVQVTINAQCTLNEVLLLRATLTQGDAFAEGTGAVLCTGNADSFPATLRTGGGNFDAGSATLCGVAATVDNIRVIDTRQTCATVTLST